jgi:hypothetical protein
LLFPEFSFLQWHFRGVLIAKIAWTLLLLVSLVLLAYLLLLPSHNNPATSTSAVGADSAVVDHGVPVVVCFPAVAASLLLLAYLLMLVYLQLLVILLLLSPCLCCSFKNITF